MKMLNLSLISLMLACTSTAALAQAPRSDGDDVTVEEAISEGLGDIVVTAD